MNFKNSISNITFIIILGLVTSCAVKTDYKIPDIRLSEGLEYKTMLTTCDKKDSDQPTVSADTLKDKMIVQDQIESKELEYVDCDGKIIKVERGPERNLSKFVMIEAPANLPEAVNYVFIENFRTCAVHKFDAQDVKIGEAKTDLPDSNGKPMMASSLLSTSDRSGNTVVQLTDSTYIFSLFLNVHEQLNVAKVKYFGKCKKQKIEKAPFVNEDSYRNCEVDNEIGSKDVVIDVQIQRPEGSGKKLIKVCNKR